MQTSEEIVKIFEGLKQFYSNKEHWEHEHKLIEEKFQILVHLLQNESLPKNSRKFVEELRRVRQQRWIISRICLANTLEIRTAIGHALSINEPKIRQCKIQELDEYVQFVKTL